MEKLQHMVNYERIASAIAFVQQHFKEQPSLSDIAGHVHISPEHFQRMFQEWAGTSPKKFLQYITLQHAKMLLSEGKNSLFEAAFDTGLSSTSRLHDLFIKIEGMTPAEYKHGGRSLNLTYAYYPTPFGNTLIASTEKGICAVAFEDDAGEALRQLQVKYPNASFAHKEEGMHQAVLTIFNKDWDNLQEIKLHLRGTTFQLKGWEALLKIPAGKLASYQQVAENLHHKRASRAVGNAIGSNPIAYLIPCHRVIQTSGVLGGYRWGTVRKKALIAWESALTLNNEDGTV